MTVTIDCIHPAVYGPGPREGLCTKCGRSESAEKPDWRVEVERLIWENKRIAAIKVYREVFYAVSLKEAKDVVDAIADEIGWEPPAPPARSGSDMAAQFGILISAMIDKAVSAGRAFGFDGFELIEARLAEARKA